MPRIDGSHVLTLWAGWHFPELAKIVNSNEQYAKVVLQIGDKSRLSDDDLHDLAAVVDDDEGVAQAIIKAARTSMGSELSRASMHLQGALQTNAAARGSFRGRHGDCHVRDPMDDVQMTRLTLH